MRSQTLEFSHEQNRHHGDNVICRAQVDGTVEHLLKLRQFEAMKLDTCQAEQGAVMDGGLLALQWL